MSRSVQLSQFNIHFIHATHMANGKMRACGDAGIQFRASRVIGIRLRLVVRIGLVLGLLILYRLAHFTLCQLSH